MNFRQIYKSNHTGRESAKQLARQFLSDYFEDKVNLADGMICVENEPFAFLFAVNGGERTYKLSANAADKTFIVEIDQ